MKNELMIRQQDFNLPSTQVQERMSYVDEEEIHIRDYLEVILRRKWVVIITLLVTFVTVVFFTFSTTPLYLATGMIKVSTATRKITGFQGMEDSYIKSQEYIATQTELLQSERVLTGLVNGMDLNNNALFNGTEKSRGSSGFFGAVFKKIHSVTTVLAGIIRPDKEAGLADAVKQKLKDQLTFEKNLKKIRGSLTVKPVKNTQLIEISIESDYPELAADMTNNLMEQFLEIAMQEQVEAFHSAGVFLEKQIEEAKIRLEKSDKELNKYAGKTGIVSLDSKMNLTMRQLEEVNEAFAHSVTLRISREALYQQSLKGDGGSMPAVLNNLLVQDLKKEYSKLLSEYQKLSTVFKDEYPEVKKIKAQMVDLQNRYEYEKQRIIASIRLEYEAALENENRLQEKADMQQKLAIKLNDKARQYKILQREVESNREVYNTLLKRSKEIGASVGSETGHISIIDEARKPLRPYKPKVFRQLILGIVLGLFGGVGLAFGLEYMDSTVKSPDEFLRRYQLPIIGVVPQSESDDPVEVAFATYNHPKDPISEAIRTSMVSIELSSAEKPPRTLLVTSVLPDTGKTTLSTNLSLSMLSKNAKVLLVDTDLRKPTLHKIFKNSDNQAGLSSFLAGVTDVNEVICKTNIQNLFYLPSGPVPLNPAEILASSRMRKFIRAAGERFDYVILDAPPFYGFAEILILSNMVDGVILVSELNKTPRDGVQYFKKAVTNVKGNILGVLVNKVAKSGVGGSPYYGGYNYCGSGYQYGQDA